MIRLYPIAVKQCYLKERSIMKIILKIILWAGIIGVLILSESVSTGPLLPTYLPPGDSSELVRTGLSRFITTILVFTCAEVIITFWFLFIVCQDTNKKFGKEAQVS